MNDWLRISDGISAGVGPSTKNSKEVKFIVEIWVKKKSC